MQYLGNSVGLKRRQRGATFLGMLVIISILLFAVYGGIRLVPLYKEYMDVSSALTQAANSLGASATPAEIRQSLNARWQIDDIKSLQPADVIISRNGSTATITADYRAEAEFIANISLVVDFKKTVTMGNAASP